MNNNSINAVRRPETSDVSSAGSETTCKSADAPLPRRRSRLDALSRLLGPCRLSGFKVPSISSEWYWPVRHDVRLVWPCPIM